MSDIKNKCVKLSCLVGEALELGYNKEASYITSYILKNAIGDYSYFISIQKDNYSLEARNNSLCYVDFLSFDLTDKFDLCYDVFLGYYLIYDVLKNVYSSKELNTVEYTVLNDLLEVTDLINYKHIKHFNEVVELVKKSLVEYLANLEVTEVNRILKQHFSLFNSKVCEVDLIFKHNNKYFITFDFKTYQTVDCEDIKDYIEDIINSLEFEDIELIIDVIL